MKTKPMRATKPWTGTLLSAAIAGVAGIALAMPSHAAGDPAQLKLGKELFSKTAVPACAVCHSLKDADANGAIGPVLDDLKPDAARVEKALRNGLGQMPAYGGTLNDQQIKALAAYVAKASGAAK